MTNITRAMAVALAALLAGSSAYAQGQVSVKEEEPGLLAQATIKPDSATRLALARVPGGQVVRAEIEKQDGTLVYSIYIKVPGNSGVEDVYVDARTGTIIKVEHEDEETEHSGAIQGGAVRLSEEKAGLLARATVTRDAAERTALARVPGGQVVKVELEEEHGKLVYSFDIKVAGKSGIDEVLVDAGTGAVVSVEHED